MTGPIELTEGWNANVDVLELQRTPTLRVHDLHGPRPGLRPHRPHIRRHPASPGPAHQTPATPPAAAEPQAHTPETGKTDHIRHRAETRELVRTSRLSRRQSHRSQT